MAIGSILIFDYEHDIILTMNGISIFPKFFHWADSNLFAYSHIMIIDHDLETFNIRIIINNYIHEQRIM